MNHLMLPNGAGTANHEGAAAEGATAASGGILAGDWLLHNAKIDYASVGGRVDVVWLQDNGQLTDLWQPFPTEPNRCARPFVCPPCGSR